MCKSQIKNIISYHNRLAIRPIIIFIFLLLPLLTINGQVVEIDVEQRPLNEVFFQLIEEYKIQLSYNDRQLSQEIVSLHQSFPSPYEALVYLIRDSPFKVEKRSDVFIVYKKKKEYNAVYGSVLDHSSHETLPYSHVIINTHGLITDVNGRFYLQSQDSVFQVSISYLGYYILDTLIYHSGKHDFLLIPSYANLQEVTIEGKTIEYSTEIGDSPGKIRLNHKTAERLPGNGDNSVFNFLRLKPGILAAGEQ